MKTSRGRSTRRLRQAAGGFLTAWGLAILVSGPAGPGGWLG